MIEELETFNSFEDAEIAERREWWAMRPTERLEVLEHLRSYSLDSNGETTQRLCRFLKALSARGAEYVIVGGHAVAFHGYPRYTGDLDVWV